MSTALQFEPLAPAWVLLFASAGLVAAAGFYYLRWNEGASAGRRRFLLSLRLLAFGLLIFAMAGPAKSRRETVRKARRLAVLVDISGSMNERDCGEEPPRSRFEAARDAFVSQCNRLAAGFDLEVYAVEESTVFLGRPAGESDARAIFEGLEADGSETPLGEAIVQAGATGAVLILSDGKSNTGRSLAEAAAVLSSRGVKAFVVPLGVEQAPNVAVRRILGPRLLLRGEPSAFFADISFSDTAASPVRVLLKDGDEAVASGQADRGKGGLVRLDFTPGRGGEITYAVEVEAPASDSNAADNRLQRAVRVAQEKLRVLYVEEAPRWEYRFLKNAILRDDRLDAKVLLVEADRRQPPPGPHIASFPATRSELFKFDVVVIGDVDAGFFLERDLENLRSFVSEGAGGVLFVGGPLHNPASYTATILGELSPAWSESVSYTHLTLPTKRIV